MNKKKFNTAQMLENAMNGIKEAGSACEWINLYDYEFTGCRNCFACKIKNSKTNGVCAIRDSIRPILEKAKDADQLVNFVTLWSGCCFPWTRQIRA